MPKGDRLKLKADPEDGTTPIANLLLEAVAMAKISGLQKGAIIYLWRETYGWVDGNGNRRKEKKITLSEWAKGLDSSNARLSHALSDLESKSIIHRRMADAWGGYYYSLNTKVYQWNSNCINLTKLSERVVGIADFGTVIQNATVPLSATVDQNNNSCDIDNSCHKRNATVDQNATQQLTKTQLPTLYKEILNKDINKEDNVLEKHSSPTEELKNTVNKIIEKSPYGEGIKQVMAGLIKRRGYNIPSGKRNGEARSIRNMLKENYSPDQILGTWDRLKSDTFWKEKELFMMTVESQIGALLAKSKTPKTGKYAHMEQR